MLGLVEVQQRIEVVIDAVRLVQRQHVGDHLVGHFEAKTFGESLAQPLFHDDWWRGG